MTERAPRVLPYLLVKRIDPRLPNTWGHWWVEMDGEESYGWWPTPCPMGWRGAMLGSRGVLNGIGTTNSGTPTRDAYHGEEPDHWFHPTLVADKTDEQVRAEIRAFARSFRGGFRWQWWWLREPAENCRTFQQEMFETVGLFEEPQYLYTQGSGCPFMYPFRVTKWRVVDTVAAALAAFRDCLPFLRPMARPGGGTELAMTNPKDRAKAKSRGVLVSDRGGAPDREDITTP